LENEDQGSGLTLVPVDQAASVHLKLPKGQGLIATSVLPQGLAAQAGICENDILLTLDDVPLGKPEDLENRLKAAGDKTLSLVLLRHGQKKTLQVQPKVKVTFGPAQPALPEFWIGVSVTPVEPALRDQLQLPADRGLVATGIMENSPAAKATFKVNDILLTLNGEPLHLGNLQTTVQKNGEKPVAVEIIREGTRQTIEVTPERRNGLSLRTARVPHAAAWNVVRPGVVLQGNESLMLTGDRWSWGQSTAPQGQDLWRVNPNPSHADPQANRLDTMAAEIKELRKAVEELSKVLKDRK
jgi:membrane-associated protease RseP (regulator of RpoE activity)